MPFIEPSDRERVLEITDDMSSVYDAKPCGQGIYVIMKHDDQSCRDFNKLMTKRGWYVDKYTTYSDGDVVVLMPVTEDTDE